MKIIELFFALVFGIWLGDATIKALFSVFGGFAFILVLAAVGTVWIALSVWSNGFTGVSPKKEKA